MAKVAEFIGLDKIYKIMQIVSQNGGIRASLYKLYRMEELKDGTLVGVDKFGNKYYESPRYFYCRNRWVEYAPSRGWEYDGSQVPAGWRGWLHFTTDTPPTKKADTMPTYKWLLEHTENMTGTPRKYTPYSTTVRKVQPWEPRKAASSTH